MFANFLIGLREGLEAALVVGILLAYLVKAQRSDAVRWLWTGVGAALLLSLGVGAALSFTSATLPPHAEETLVGVFSVIAVGFVTWMIFWMQRTARDLRSNLHGKLGAALATGGSAIATVAFLAVAREGIETSLFIWAAVRTAGSAGTASLGAFLGLATATFVGWLFYRGALRIDLGKFFTWTGAALVLVAAGVFASGLHEFQEAGLLPGAESIAFDVTRWVHPDSWLDTLLGGTLNFTATPSWLEVLAWIAYAVPVMFFFTRRTAVRETVAPEPQPVR